jgi:cyclopropane fatty-acyl-phospholipid synthase-like methyltransferase
MSEVTSYFDTARVEDAVRQGKHRTAVGGMWDEIGPLQLAFLKEKGLRPSDSLLDIGCGCLRGGVHLVEYLDPGNYFGFDVNQSLLDAGYEVELGAVGLRGRLPRENLLCGRDFEVERFGREFDFALALSLFTHLTLNHIRVCLERLTPWMNGRGNMYATYNEIPASHPTHEPFREWPGRKTTYATREPYHYRFDDLAELAAGVAWRVEKVPDFVHPRGQSMLRFVPQR